MFNSHNAGINLQLCFDDSDPFAGFSRSYGMFSNVHNYLAPVIDPSFGDALECAAFCAEEFAVRLVTLGLGSCFVSGTYSASHVNAQMEVYEKLPFILPFGYPVEKQTILGGMLTKMIHRKKMSPGDFFEGTDEEYADAVRRIPQLETALEAVACAPSAMNRRPVRLAPEMEAAGRPSFKAFTVTEGDDALIDLGIAKANVAMVIDGVWDWGQNALFHI